MVLFFLAARSSFFSLVRVHLCHQGLCHEPVKSEASALMLLLQVDHASSTCCFLAFSSIQNPEHSKVLDVLKARQAGLRYPLERRPGHSFYISSAHFQRKKVLNRFSIDKVYEFLTVPNYGILTIT